MEISGSSFDLTERDYEGLVRGMPFDNYMFPSFYRFVSGGYHIQLDYWRHYDTYNLTDDQYHRYQMILSPHATTLLRVYIINLTSEGIS